METKTDTDISCRHHWLLGQPESGEIGAVCRKCGARRTYPASFEDYERAPKREERRLLDGVATAAGGARPSSVALLVDLES